MSIHHCFFHHCFFVISFIAKNKTKKVFNIYMKHNGRVIIHEVGVVSFFFVFKIIQSC
jgi:transcriptional regulator